MTVERIYELYVDFVFRSLKRLGVPDCDVADAVQEVFLAVHRTLAEFEQRCSMKTWLFTICRSTARDRRRKAHQRYEVLDASRVSREPDAQSDFAARAEDRQQLAEVEAILETLDGDQRMVFVLFELEAMTGAEISDALGIPLGTVYSRLRLGRAAFRAAVLRRQAASSPALLRTASKS